MKKCRLFKIAKQTGIIDKYKTVRHVPFGVVLGQDGKKLKSRSGETVRLKDLLTETIAHSKLVADQRMSDKLSSSSISSEQLPDENCDWGDDRDGGATALGLAAVKYADLSQNRESNYKYNPNKMMSLTGNTAPYMLYALARIRFLNVHLLTAFK